MKSIFSLSSFRKGDSSAESSMTVQSNLGIPAHPSGMDRSSLMSINSNMDPNISFGQLVAEINKLFADLSKENIVLKAELQKLQETSCRGVGFDPSQMPGSTSEGDDLMPVTRMMSNETNAEEAALLSEDRQSAASATRNTAGRWSSKESEPLLGVGTQFYPEWPLNLRPLQMHGRLAEPARLSVWEHVQQPLQVPLELWAEFNTGFAHDPCIILPNGYFRLTWDLMSCTVLFVQLWLTPFTIAFAPEAGAPAYFSYLENFTTLFFFTDMILNFNTGIIRHVEDYDWIVMNRRAIAKDYCSFFFWVDLVSTIPFDKLVQNGDTDLFSMVRIVRMARWLKLLRFLRLTRLLKMLQWISKSFELEIERLKKQLVYPLVAIAITAVLAHVNTCILQALEPREVLLDNMLEVYFHRLAHVLFALIAGVYVEAYSEPLSFLYLSIAIERLAMVGIAGFSLVYQAMLVLEQVVKSELQKKDVLLYMEQRKVSHTTQVRVLDHFKAASHAVHVKRSYENWIASGIPVELERAIGRELWLPRLKTLGLIDYILHMKPPLQDDLVLIVREETLAKNNVLFQEGMLPHGAYLVLQGVIRAHSSLTQAPLPLFTADMWVGEKALVSPEMARTITCVCQSTCVLMTVPAQSFRKLLLDHCVLGQFEDYCVENLWLGICGRCGVVGDHFAHECPLTCSWATSATCKEFNDEEHRVPDISDDSALEHENSNGPVPRERFTKSDLKEFLLSRRLEHLLPELEICGVWSLSDLQGISPEDKRKIISFAADVQPGLNEDLLEQELSYEYIEQFRDNLEDRAKEILGTSEQRSQHLLFLSHHKLDCGTEATLLRQELDIQIQEDLRLRIMETPVFLDTENLNSLARLTEHVANTHNILLLLSPDVLRRPWVLIELITAKTVDMPVIPVEIRKPGQQFKYPDEKFYDRLLRGKILPRKDEAILRAAGMSLEDAVSSMRRVFDKISLPYSPHRPAVHRKLEVSEILRHCDYHPGVSQRDRRRTLLRFKSPEYV